MQNRHRSPCKVEPIEARLLFTTIYVDANRSGGAQDGSSWAGAFSDLQQALAISVAGDSIHVADGIYRPTTTGNTGATFQLHNGVAMLGGFAGFNSSDPDARDPNLYPSILSGNTGSITSASDDSNRIVSGENLDSTSTLDGFTVRDAGGRGIFLEYSSPTIRNCIITANRSGGMWCTGGAPLVENCAFLGNTAGGGGGLYNLVSSPTLVNCVFVGNLSTYTGGAIFNEVAAPTLINCTVVANVAADGGGAIFSVDDQPTVIRNSIFRANTSVSKDQILGYGPLNIQYSDIQGGAAGLGNVDVDPVFVKIPSPGLDGHWGTSDDDYGDLRIHAGSPVVDASDNAAIPAGIATDLAGNNRFEDIPTTADTGTGAGPIADMGAFETVPALVATVGGPYSVARGRSITLQAYAASDVPGAIQYAWDTNGDHVFDDGNASRITIPTADLPAASILTVTLRATDSAFHTVVTDVEIVVLPTTMYVDLHANGANNGTSWTNAFTSLFDALNQAVSGITLKVAQGTYTPTNDTNRYFAFALKSGVKIYGGYAGAAASDPEIRNVTATPTLLSGDIGNSGDTSDNSYHVLIGDGIDSTALLDGVTISGGNADSGGGMYLIDSSPTFSNCIFSLNRAAGTGALYLLRCNSSFTNCTFASNVASRGGAIYAALGSLSIDHCLFASNSSGEGGAIAIESADVTINDCSFSSNSGSGGAIWNHGQAIVTHSVFTGNGADNASGGAIINLQAEDPKAIIEDCTFVNNHADSGGAIYSPGTSPSITNCVFTGNSAKRGGAIYNSGGVLTSVINCTFTRNSAREGGGAITNYSCPAIILNCIFYGNKVTENGTGGGLEIVGSAPTVMNCTFVGNTATAGGAVSDLGSAGKLINCTITNNVASQKIGGALYTTVTSLNLTNCIIYFNSTVPGPIYNSGNQSTIITFSDVEGGFAGAGNLNADPLFKRNPSAGSDGVWGTPDDDYGDLRLRRTSPAIDAGDNSVIQNGGSPDLAGNPRIVDVLGVRDPGERVDLGAFEFADVLYRYNRTPVPAIAIAVGVNIDPESLNVGDLHLVNRDTGLELEFASFATASFDPSTQTAYWVLSRALLDGNYRATVLAGSVSDTAGNQLPGDIVGDFFVLAGDTNRDRKVDIQDLAILASNWQGDAKIFSQGDFNYDGKVDAADLGILAGNWQKTLAAPPAVSASILTPSRPPRRQPTRVAELVN